MQSETVKFHDRLLNALGLKWMPQWVHPNHLTVSRFILTPLVMWFAVTQQYGWAIPLFLLTAFTDVLDGSLARLRSRVTSWGKVYDPVADKLLIGSLVAILVIQHLGFYLGIAIICIEVLFIGLGWWWLLNGHVVQANRWGKIKMNLEVLGVLLLLIGLATGFTGLYGISETTFYLAIFFALISLFTSGV